MAKFHPRGIAVLLFLALLLAGFPSWGETRRSSTGRVVPPAVSLQEEAARIIRFVVQLFSPKSGNTLDPDGNTRQTAAQGGSATGTGRSLDPNG
jgi:hypothetical protein